MSEIKVRLRYAMRENDMVNIREFEEFRGKKDHPKGLTCPECERPVMARLSPEQKMRDHFAHYPDSECALKETGERSDHLNAKFYVAAQLRKYRKLALGFKCFACASHYPFLKFADYDRVCPETKIGNRRPDISCFNGASPVGSVEIYLTSRVQTERAADLNGVGVPWFEMPTSGVHPQYWNPAAFQLDKSNDTAIIDARAAGVMYPAVPAFCDPCVHRYPEKVRRVRLDMEAALEKRLAEDEKMDEAQRERLLAIRNARFAPERFREIVQSAPLEIPQQIITGLEIERVMPELDEYGVRLSMRMSGPLYMLVSNYRRDLYAERKNGRAKLAENEEE